MAKDHASGSSTTKKGFFLWRWLKRGVLGGSKEFTVANERYDSPGRLAVKRFFRRPAALIAVIVLIAMFLLVIIGPIFVPFDNSYAETMHKNVAPNFSMMSIPKSMKNSTKEISSYGVFTVGLSEAGKVYMWGYTGGQKGKATLEIPEEVQNANILHVAAGADHVIAIGDDGKVYGWGQYNHAQYGEEGSMLTGDIVGYVIKEPDEFLHGTIADPTQVRQLICGNQVSAVLMEDGTLYGWGNYVNGAKNMMSFLRYEDVEKIVFTSAYMLGISRDGTFLTAGASAFANYEVRTGELAGKIVDTQEYIGSRKAVDIAATGDAVALLLDDGELMVLGGTQKSIAQVPAIPEGDSIQSIMGGARHFTMVTKQGRAYSWGGNTLNQTEVPKEMQKEGAVDTVWATGFQNYAFKDGKLVKTWGHKGYLMGTDDLGRDVFERVINGGRMTMTIGAVAVVISSIIGIIIGCISGYFGGKTDMILMRVTEVFGAIPFLPFALILSAVLAGSDVRENTRIFIIMLILGVLSWTGLARLVRGQVLAEREKEFVTAAKSMGVRESRIAFKHILPNIISVILVTMTLDFASCMLTESSLSYLGFGVKLPRPTWGNMLYGCNNSIVIQSYWWRWLFPAIFLSIAVICINVIGDTLRDVLDPKSEVDR